MKSLLFGALLLAGIFCGAWFMGSSVRASQSRIQSPPSHPPVYLKASSGGLPLPTTVSTDQHMLPAELPPETIEEAGS